MAGHYPIVSYGDHGDTLELQQYLLPLLVHYNVSIYLCGHDHISEHVVISTERLNQNKYLLKPAQRPLHSFVIGSGSMIDYLKYTNSVGELIWYGIGYTAFGAINVTATTFAINFIDNSGQIVYDFELDTPNFALPSKPPSDVDIDDDDDDDDNSGQNRGDIGDDWISIDLEDIWGDLFSLSKSTVFAVSSVFSLLLIIFGIRSYRSYRSKKSIESMKKKIVDASSIETKSWKRDQTNSDDTDLEGGGSGGCGGGGGQQFDRTVDSPLEDASPDEPLIYNRQSAERILNSDEVDSNTSMSTSESDFYRSDFFRRISQPTTSESAGEAEGEVVSTQKNLHAVGRLFQSSKHISPQHTKSYTFG